MLGVTTVAGNVPLALTQRNARFICELAGKRNIPIYAGCPRPLVRSLQTAEQVDGKTGDGFFHLLLQGLSKLPISGLKE